MVLEVCVNSVVSAIEAQKGGADRVELCENMSDGGCTPSAGSILLAKKQLDIPVFVMIRPRGGDFNYSDIEFEIMKADIDMAKNLGAEGVVFGILSPDGRIDLDRMEELAHLSRPMGITCHRAFDMTRDPYEAIEDLIDLGIDRVLTSGQADSALEGAPLIQKLIEKARNRILIMPGHGVKEHNLHLVITATGAEEYHMYLNKQVQSEMNFVREDVKMGTPSLSEYEFSMTDESRVRAAKQILVNFNG